MEHQLPKQPETEKKAAKYANFFFKNQNEIIKNLQALIDNEICLELHPINHEINDRLKSTYEELLIQLKLDLRKNEKMKWQHVLEVEQITQLENKIKQTVYKIIELKEINIYFRHLYKESTALEADVQKFLFYKPKSQNLEEKLEDFFSSPTVSQLFLKQYEKSFNFNNFSADLIEFFHFLHTNSLLQIPPCEKYSSIRNKDIILIQNTTIIFRQICEINDKYAHVEQQLLDSYENLKYVDRCEKQSDFVTTRLKEEEEKIIQDKFTDLTKIANKIKYMNGNIAFPSKQAKSNTIILLEQPDNFNLINQQFEYNMKTRNQQFLAFIENLYDQKQMNGLEDVGKVSHLNFLRTKIIKAQTRWHLNRIISSFNVGSHIINQVQNRINPQPQKYIFTSPSKLSKYQFNSKRISFYKNQESPSNQLPLLNKNVMTIKKDDNYILKIQKNKIIYPSAINNYYYFLKYLIMLSALLEEKKIYSDELILQVIQIKAGEFMEWAQIVLNLHDIIKGKYFRCYKVLQNYTQLIFQIKYQQELDYLTKYLVDGPEGISQLLQFFISKEKKAGCISQIIFEFDTDHDIRESIIKLYQIEKMHSSTFYFTDNPHFYETILNEVIQTKNQLKFDRCYSFNSLHQLFGFLSARPSSLKDLAEQLTPLSKNHLRLPDLLRFYAAQTKLKRQVFKAELYWITIAETPVKYKFIINSQKKKISFKDFLEQNAKNLMSLTDKPLAYFITNLQEFQRSVLLFCQEVERLKLIQSSLIFLKPDFPLEDHLSAFSYKQLLAFFQYVTQINLIENIFIRRQKKNWLLTKIKKDTNGCKLKFNDICLEPPLISLKNQLSNHIFYISAFEHHYSFNDCMKLIKNVIKQGEVPEYHLKLQILRSKREILKEYEECQFMDFPALSELAQIYAMLIFIAINRLIRRKDIELADIDRFKKIRSTLPGYSNFKIIEILNQIQEIKQYSHTTSKVHTINALKNIIQHFKNKKDSSKSMVSAWPIVQNLCLMTNINIISRRLFCNQIIQLKRDVSGDQWKSFNKSACLHKLRKQFDKQFILQVNSFIQTHLQGENFLNVEVNINESLIQIQELFRKQILIQYDGKYALEEVNKKEIVLFDQFRGYEVEQESLGREDETKIGKSNAKKQNRINFKRGMLNIVKRQDEGSTNIINQLQNRVNLEIVKQSLPVRKMIYHLQLEQKRIKDEISWQTCKLQHNVINKINKFIQQSNLDQKQSLINFKYTVNLETIKGIENVIHQRTEIFSKNDWKQPQNSGFITEPKQQQKDNLEKQEQTLLDVNVKNIFSHVKKLKIFWAWKNIYMSKQSGEDEWSKFGENAEKILNNNQNIARIQNLQQLRTNCNKHQIICNLIKEENTILNSSIRNMKLSNLTQKLNSFKDKHKIEEQMRS